MLAPFSQISVLRQHFTLGFFSVTRVLKKRRQRRRRKWQKSNRLRLVMNNISLFLCTFLIRRCTTTTYNFLISFFKICTCSGIVALEFDRIAIYYSKGSFPCRRRCFKLPFILKIASNLSSWRDLWASAVFFFSFLAFEPREVWEQAAKKVPAVSHQLRRLNNVKIRLEPSLLMANPKEKVSCGNFMF